MFKCSTWRFAMCLLYKLLCLCACFFFPRCWPATEGDYRCRYYPALLLISTLFLPGRSVLCSGLFTQNPEARMGYAELSQWCDASHSNLWRCNRFDRKHVLRRQTPINVRRTFCRNPVQLECKNAWQFRLKMSEITRPVFHFAAHPSFIVAFKYYIFQL